MLLPDTSSTCCAATTQDSAFGKNKNRETQQTLPRQLSSTLEQPQLSPLPTATVATPASQAENAWMLHSWMGGVRQHSTAQHPQPAAQRTRKDSASAHLTLNTETATANRWKSRQ
jgi:hypothetical protein